VLPERARAFKKLRKQVRRLRPLEHGGLPRRAPAQKQLRYALECGADMFGNRRTGCQALRRLQDCLGAQQDARTAKNRLTSIVADE
jgi:CHAD domain-containing protein